MTALCQLRALLHLAQRLLNDNPCGQLCSLQDADLSRRFVQEYSSMHKACFYGRCLGFQVSTNTTQHYYSIFCVLVQRLELQELQYVKYLENIMTYNI